MINKKSLVKIWVVLIIVNFFLYDVLWFSLGDEDFSWDNSYSRLEIFSDFIFCCVLSLVSMVVCDILVRHFLHKGFISMSQLTKIAIISLIINIIIIFTSEYVYDMAVFGGMSYADLWDNSYLLAFIATFNTLFYTNQYYSELAMYQYEQAVDYKKRILKAQLNPHFIFNSLNVLAELTRIDAVKAEQFTIRLSRLYYYVLNGLSNDWVSIPDAIDFVRNYVAVMNVRFDNHIILDTGTLSRQQLSDIYILSMSLQVVLENAIKHCGLPDGEQLHIRVDLDDNYMIIANNYKPQNNNSQKSLSLGVGLKNLEERYLLDTKKKPVVEKTNDTFVVKLPITKK